MTGYRFMSLDSRSLVKTMKGMLSARPNESRARLPCEAPPTASMLSSDMVTSATTITLIASRTLVAWRPLSSSSPPWAKSLSAIQRMSTAPTSRT